VSQTVVDEATSKKGKIWRTELGKKGGGQKAWVAEIGMGGGRGDLVTRDGNAVCPWTLREKTRKGAKKGGTGQVVEMRGEKLTKKSKSCSHKKV